MIVVSDTSPISNLFVIGKLELLRDVFQKVIIPPSVFDELMKLKDFGYKVEFLSELNWIEVRHPNNQKEVKLLRLSLDAGESEAIVLSKEIHAELLLIDERFGAKKAKDFGLKTIGLLGVLVRAKRMNFIIELKPLLDELENNAGFWMSEKLKKEVLKSVGE
ncbi:MAG TPA: DUF3368 domain-containing protein [Saprospiraceae bacterium]|nr:DUF3368 domain-containing protein [Saprospiraceae bacterium]